MLLQLLLWFVLVVQSIAILALYKQLFQLHRIAASGTSSSASALPAGARAPPFSAIDLASRLPYSSAQFTGRRVALLFLSPHCSVCKRLARALHKAKHAVDTRSLVVYCDGTARGCANAFSMLFGDVPILTKADSDVPSVYQLSGLPAAVFIGIDGRIEKSIYAEKLTDILPGIDDTRPLQGHDEVTQAAS